MSNTLNKEDLRDYVQLCKKYDISYIHNKLDNISDVNLDTEFNCLRKLSNIFGNTVKNETSKIYSSYGKWRNENNSNTDIFVKTDSASAQEGGLWPFGGDKSSTPTSGSSDAASTSTNTGFATKLAGFGSSMTNAAKTLGSNAKWADQVAQKSKLYSGLRGTVTGVADIGTGLVGDAYSMGKGTYDLGKQGVDATGRAMTAAQQNINTTADNAKFHMYHGRHITPLEAAIKEEKNQYRARICKKIHAMAKECASAGIQAGGKLTEDLAALGIHLTDSMSDNNASNSESSFSLHTNEEN